MLSIARLFVMALSDLVLAAAFSLDQRNSGDTVGVIRVGWAFWGRWSEVGAEERGCF